MKLHSSSVPSDSEVHIFGIASHAPTFFLCPQISPNLPVTLLPNFLLTRMGIFILVINVTNCRVFMLQVNYLRILYGDTIFNKNIGALQLLPKYVF